MMQTTRQNPKAVSSVVSSAPSETTALRSGRLALHHPVRITTRRIRIASIAISIFCTSGVIANVYLVGPHQIFWTYPALIAIFYRVRPREAVVFALITNRQREQLVTKSR